jgi:hypothetical protein
MTKKGNEKVSIIIKNYTLSWLYYFMSFKYLILNIEL